ncbi:Undecaprenyl-diphosphatase [Tepidanaerobacter acetatoxydans Re1]|uniref:Undecaprenyl-diphosphatase n=1 Tax=Tepidanaerobacter acetatoxydans (strain DSM 21804 / JCM 16047 / Re1) TaxID=1209989 RepID=F4LVX9_TEPAE|nr:undecaprenyl-diphosphate phosphatase [Tepidanaerobacter acetatoxydans]AEE91647.1 Undecaprenyl-diphosphatase [Tepidanaerobacter acetatoxydans Re1]CCP26389.1 Undecaprenyl-diphosphatase [Tepidanaerobacter acetatoxydans Re1]
MSLLFKAAVMGIVEGITEFLPISSTGHMIIVGDFIDFKGNSFHTMFEIVIQLGAILAVVYYYRYKIIDSIKHIRPGEKGFELWFKIFIAFLPAAVIGLLINDVIEKYLFSSFTVAIALVVGGFLMILAENYFGRSGLNDMDKTDLGQAFIIGIGQCLALIPGMSRSASTIMGGMAAGLSVKAAAEFSFFLAIPTMVAATGFSLFKGYSGTSPLELQALVVGFVVSFIVALLAVDRFLSYLKQHSLKPFAYYRIVVGIIMILLITTGIL